ncbi:hypothetical protein Tco_0611070 [Tanacetum coccineum]
MEEIFDQMSAEVDHNTVDKQCAENKRKNLLIANENLIANCLSNQLMFAVEQSRCLDLEAEISKLQNENQKDVNDEMIRETQLQEKDNVIRNLKAQVSKMNDRSCETYNAKDVTDLIEQNERVRVELEKVKQHYKEFDSVKPKVLTPGMYAIDVKPIPPPLKNNRSAHLNYINHLKESVETIREIIEEDRVVKPLDNALNYAYQYTKLSQELLEYVIGTCPKSFNESDNKAPSTPIIRPTEKKFSLGKFNCGYQWRPIGKKFTLGELCPSTKPLVVQVILWYLDSGCSKHMTGNHSKLKNFVEKFIEIVRLGNDHFGAIMGYGYYVIGDSVISRVYYVEGLGHNLCTVGQFCDSDLEIAFRTYSCFVRDMNGVDLLKGSRSTILYTISIDDMMKSSLVCLLSKASKIKSSKYPHRS